MPSTEHRRRRSRRKHTVYFDLVETADARFDRIIEGLLIAMLAFAPLALGAVQAWSERIVIALACAMALCLAIKLIRRPDVPFVWSWTYLPIVLFLAFVAFQLIPLPAATIRAISPQTWTLRTSLQELLPESQRNFATMPLSFYPQATWNNLRLLLAISTVYVVALNIVRQAKQFVRLLTAIALIGVVIAVIAFLHLLSGAEHVYGTIGDLNSAWPLAPFINRNHFGQFMNLSLGATAALLLVQLEQFLRSRKDSDSEDVGVLGEVPPLLWTIAAAMILLGVAVFLSLSRGAILSAAVGAALAIFFAQYNHMRISAWLFVPVAWAVALLVIYFGFDSIAARFVQSGAMPQTEGRWQILHDALLAWKQFPILGIGMGAFETTFPMFDHSSTLMVATHAENEYVQTLLEGGLVGLGIVLVFVVMILGALARNLRSAPSPMASAAIGLGFGLAAILVQSFTDFGQHVPANAMLTAVLCALAVTQAHASRRTKAEAVAPARGWIALRFGGAAATCVVGGWMLWDISQATAAERNLLEARRMERVLANRHWQGDIEDYRQLLIAATLASEARPLNVEYRYALNEFRWQAIIRDHDATGKVVPTQQFVDDSQRLVNELLQGTNLCPTHGPSYLLAGRIEREILSQKEHGAALIRMAFRLTQNDPAANFQTALVDASDGQWDASLQKLKHAAELSGDYRALGIQALCETFNRSDLAFALAGDDLTGAQQIVQIMRERNDLPATGAAQAQFAALVRRLASAHEAPAAVLVEAARLAVTEKNYQEAIRCLKQALSQDYSRADWRMELARALENSGNAAEAIQEAQLAKRMGSGEADAMILRLRLTAAGTQPGQ